MRGILLLPMTMNQDCYVLILHAMKPHACSCFAPGLFPCRWLRIQPWGWGWAEQERVSLAIYPHPVYLKERAMRGD